MQYTAAQVLLQRSCTGSMSPVLFSLHWLPLSQRIIYKILLLVYKCLNGLAPPYLSELISWKTSSRCLRSNDQLLLNIPKIGNTMSKVKYGDRTFSVAAPSLWNQLPLHVKSQTTTLGFKKSLKTHLFNVAFKND